MPQKDMLFLLTQYAKKFIKDFNSHTDKSHYIFQTFPLYAFFEKEIPANEIKNCTIYAPQNEAGRYFFPVNINGFKTEINFAQQVMQISGKESCETQKMKQNAGISENSSFFAKSVCKDCADDAEQKTVFPLNVHVFRIGKTVIENNDYSKCWEIFDDKWIKIKNDSK